MLRAIRFVSASVFLILMLLAAARAHAAESSGAARNDECAAASRAAERLQHEGQLRAARADLATCVVPSCPRQVMEECQRQLAAIDATLPAVVLVALDEANQNMTAVHVSMDGRALIDRLDGTPISVDPGEHRFTFDAPGFRPVETTIVALPQNRKIRVMAFLSRARTAEARQATIASRATGARADRPEPAFVQGRERKLGLGLGAAGIAGLAVGAIWAIRSKTTYDHALASECGGDLNQCSSQGIVDGQTAHQQAAVATVGFVAAGTLLAAAAAVYFMASTATRVAVGPTVADNNGGLLTMVGQW